MSSCLSTYDALNAYASSESGSQQVVTLQAPYNGTFVLAVCDVFQSNCSTAGGTNPAYAFTTTLVNGGEPAATAAAETKAGQTISGSQALTVGAFEAGGGSR